MTLNTPSGRPASVRSFASSMHSVGSFSDGFITKVFPVAMATGNIHIGTMAGKLNGLMPATTPSGTFPAGLILGVVCAGQAWFWRAGFL